MAQYIVSPEEYFISVYLKNMCKLLLREAFKKCHLVNNLPLHFLLHFVAITQSGFLTCLVIVIELPMSPLILLIFTLCVWSSIMYTFKVVVSSRHFNEIIVFSLDHEGFLASVFILNSALPFLTLHTNSSFLVVNICHQFMSCTFMQWSWTSQTVGGAELQPRYSLLTVITARQRICPFSA